MMDDESALMDVLCVVSSDAGLRKYPGVGVVGSDNVENDEYESCP